MNQLIKKYIYKNRISILFATLVLSVLLYSFFFKSHPKVDSNKETLHEENNKSLNAELKIKKSETDSEILQKDHNSKELKSEIEDNKIISKKKKLTEDKKQKIEQKKIVSKSKHNEDIFKKNPNEIVYILHSGLEKISHKKSFERKEIIDLINKTFDIEKMVSIIIGKKWKDLKPNIKKDLILVFEEYVAKNYFKRFSKISKPKFLIEDQNKVSQYLLIKTVLIIKNSEEVRIDYLLSNEKKSWKIFDVLIDGAISEIATKKSEFSIYIKNDNIDSLINALREINTKLIKN